MKLRVARAPLAELPGWDDWAPSADGGSVFHRAAVLRCAGADEALLVLRGETRLAALPLTFVDGELTRRSYSLPYFGPVFARVSPGAAADLRRSVLPPLLAAVQAATPFASLPLHPAHQDLVPWLEAGFLAEARFTWRMDLREPEDARYARLDRERRSALAAAGRAGLTVTSHTDPSRIDVATYARFSPWPGEIALLGALVADLFAAGAGAEWIAADPAGAPRAKLLVVWDDRSAYVLHSAFPRDERRDGAPTLVHWEAIRAARARGLPHFDFEGSVLPGVERFYRSFGGVQTPCYRVVWGRDVARARSTLYDAYVPSESPHA